jgi:RHS repeat-associated protein
LTAKWNPTTNPTAQSGDPNTTYSYWNTAAWADRVYQMTLPANVSNQVAYERYEYDRNASGAACPGRGLVTKITHADGRYQSSGYNQFGNKMWEENELRQRTSYAYDNYSRVLSITKPVIGTETFNYLKPGTTSTYLHTTNSVYTHTSRTGIVTNNIYDPDWHKTSTTVAPSTLNLTTRFAYDYVGNLTDVTDPRSKVTVNVYDGRNRKTSTTEASGTTLARTTVWHYDGASNINRIDRADGRTETKGFDALNRVTWHNILRQVAGNDPVNVRTSFFYNPSGTIEHVTDPNGKNTSFLYDASDRKTRMTYHDNSYQSWAYDNAGNLASRTTVSNKTQSFTYDNRNRKTGMSWTNGVDSGSFTYDDAGRLLIATSPNSTVTRTYNAAGWLTVDQQYPTSLPGGARTVNYFYDDDGKVTRTYVGSASYDYDFSYDAMGRFEKIFVHGSANPSFQYYYDSASNETQRRTYLSTGVNMDKLTPRDSLNRMARRDLKINGTPFSAEAYVYDRIDRLVEVNRGSVSDLFGWYWDGQLYWAQYGFQQDMPSQEGGDPDMDTRDNVDPYANYQPPEVEEPEPPAPPENYAELPLGGVAQPDSYQRWVAYLLDRGGNRMQVVDTSSGTANYTRSTINQYTAVTGCMVANGAEHEVSLFKAPTDAQQVNYYYINDERLKQVTSGSNTYDLKYDAVGRCVKRTLNGTTTYYIYDGEKPVVEYNSSGTVIARNVYGKGVDEILTRTETGINGGQPFYYGDDHEGSVTHLLDRNGNKIEIYKYDVFGAPTFYNGSGTQITSTAYNNRFLFTGREYAATYRGTYVAPFGFYEYRARAYHPSLGRFMSEDPKLFDAGDYNLFRYCHNDPLDLTDPMGLEINWAQVSFETGMTFLGGGIGAFIGGAGGGALGLAGGPAAPATVPAGASMGAMQGAAIGGAIGNRIGHSLAPMLFKTSNPNGSKGQQEHQAAKNVNRPMPSASSAAKTEEAVFWSGRQGANRAAAEAFASSTGRTTLEMTPAGRALEAAGGNISQWKALAADFARGASGEVNAFTGGARASSVWNTVEKPLLMQNPNVTKIIINDAVNTSKTTIIYP